MDEAIVDDETLNRDCDLLRSLHVPGRPLVLPNAWDAASARAVVTAGFPVVATTSAGVAESLGYADHEGAPAAEMLAAAARIRRAVDAPVTVDAEAGYELDPATLVGELRRVGAAGCNLEDSVPATGAQRDPGEQAEWIAAVRAAADAVGYRLVINARIDDYIREIVARLKSGESPLTGQEHHLAAAVDRAHRYLAAGADCVYPIGLHQADQIAAFVQEADGRVNLAPIPGAGSPAELAGAGIA
ncbi:MAG TPA: isocitrate lyase/phosphoenolpyruvate mutase family protein, partial [Microlunatus sp.]|nr:isocitrate lyase/phosphoenolpyruvate mutase family protein [Microlunatus sp.]